MHVESEPLPNAASGTSVHIANAGLVLLNPYLPALFDRLGLLTASADGQPRVTGAEATSRAVHLLQYLVTGRLDTPAAELALNKLLAGISLSAPVAPEIGASPADFEICDGLLAAVIARWPAIRNTSVDGLRETFLQRGGRLESMDDGWRLTVQRKTLDVLVDQIPWSFTTIFHRWMPGQVHVGW